MSDELEAVVDEVRVERDKAYDALAQIKRAMPQLKELLMSWPNKKKEAVRIAAGIKLAALADATVQLIDEVLPEGYGKEEDEPETDRG